MKRFLILVLTLALALALVACGGGDDTPSASTPDPTPTPTPEPTPTPDPDPDPEPDPELLDFEGLTFVGDTVVYDGKEHVIEISGTLPEGATVSYTSNKGTGVGTYNASARVECDGYNTKTLTATLTIKKADITGITLTGSRVEYDTETHSIQVVGNVPAGVTVSYTYNGEAVSGVSAVGSYEVKATLSSANHNTLVLSATLTITSTESRLNAVNFGGVIYFQNDLDGQKLYKYEDGEVVKVNNDVPEYFFTDGTDLYYYSTSIFSKMIKKISGAGIVSGVCSVNGEYLTTDGEYIYFAKNALLIGTDENGIYRYKLDGSEEEPTRISSNKAAYLTVVDGDLYYSNLSDKKHLYKLSLDSGVSTLVFEEKVEYIIEDNGILYFDATDIASAIYKYNISNNTFTKMSTDSGKYLTKLGNDIYYINNDLLTSTLFGDGIYKLSVLQSGNLPGTKVISAENNGYSSLTTDGEYLYYYKLNDKHLWRYDVSTGEELDLMAGYVPPVEKTLLMGSTVIAEYNGEIYYTNPTDGLGNGACLYKYNPSTNQHVKVLADDVAGVWFNDGKMYYSTCILTNYALFVMDLETGESAKVNSDRCENLIFEGEYLYYLNVSVVGAKNSIVRIKLTDIGNPEIEPEVIFKDKNVGVSGMFKSGDTFYFVVNPVIGSQKLHSFTIGDKSATDLGETAFEVVAVGDTLYFYDDYDNEIKCYKNGTVTTLVSNVTVNDLCVSGGVLYYSSTKTTVGVYSYNLSGGAKTQISEGVGEALTVVDGKLWFVGTAVEFEADYPIHKGDGDGALYCYDGTTLTKK